MARSLDIVEPLRSAIGRRTQSRTRQLANRLLAQRRRLRVDRFARRQFKVAHPDVIHRPGRWIHGGVGLWVSLMWGCVVGAGEPGALIPHQDQPRAGGRGPARLVVTREMLPSPSPWMRAIHTSSSGLDLLSVGYRSKDGGRTWQPLIPEPRFDVGLPFGYRRVMHTPFYDEFTGKVVMVLNAMDTPGIDPTLVEPVEALQHTSLRYRVSSDGGQTYVFDEPVIVEGRSQSSPAPDVVIGHNAIFMGDGGSQLLRTRGGTVLVPAVMTLADEGGALVNPGGGGTWTDVAMVRGVWSADGHLRWTDVARVSIDPRRSTRGLDEPTLAELSDGRIVAVMRGSNGGALDPDFAIPGRRWVSLSTDDGRTWDEPRPLTVDGAPCFSPSSMSHLLRHSSGRLFWIGNLSAENPRGNSPRWPLVIAEVDERAVTLIGSTITIVDTLRPEDGDGIELSPHGPAIEDRITSDILIPMLRFRAGYTSWLPVLYRLSVDRG